jgi:hypothetical protein
MMAADFAREVHPVLQRACFECHGAEQGKGGLRLHERQAMMKADHLEILRRVSLPRTDKEAMPRRGEPLKTGEIAALRSWIESGAEWPEAVQAGGHWSYVPPVRPTLPQVKETAWSRNPVDAFVAARLEKEGLAPSPEAEPEVLLRRLTLDITGLPPSTAEVDSFVNAWSQEPERAVGEAVDRLLASREFGVRWARPWLDAARYADSHGFQRDDLREIWGFRDWVVDALNRNLRFDQFTIEQVAGDLIPGARPEQVIATGFHRCTPTNVEAGTEPEESRINQVLDRVNTTGAVWLGTTLECAQCHNHKYDPFSQRDYYSLLAYFNNTRKEAERANPKVPGSIKFEGMAAALPDPTLEERRRLLQRQIADLEKKAAEAKPTMPAELARGRGAARGLKALSIEAESGAETEQQPDLSLLFTGEAPDKDVYEIDYELPEGGQLSGLLVEALSDEALPGKGPGRGAAARPNFVLQHLEASLVAGGSKGAAAKVLRFSRAHADFSQKNFPVEGLVDENPQTGWAIMPRFGESHWAALELAEPMMAAEGARLRLRLVQNYGGGRVIGRLRVSAIQGDVLAALPEEPEKADEKAGKVPVEAAGIRRQIGSLQKQLAGLKAATSEVMRELPEPRMTAIFKRGVYTDLGEPVKAGTPEIIKVKAEGPPNRLSLARWLVSRDNPLTARVTVNRWWAELFGRGIVATVEDFGIKGSAPSHPELLDWLAVEFMESGWDMKHVLKLVVTSRTYRQSSRFDGAGLRADPENILLWRGPRLRMDAEMIRDNALAVSGLLNLMQGGPPIRPPQPEGLWAKVGGQQYPYEVSPGAEQHRRGLYIVLKRGSPYPSLVNFDASARTACVVKRSRSNTPLQALTLLNDPVYVEAARAFAARILREMPGAKVESRLRHAVRLALAREPRPEELSVLELLIQQQMKNGDENRAWQAVATALLNLDETITKG